mgnify:CR=1 FL=1
MDKFYFRIILSLCAKSLLAIHVFILPCRTLLRVVIEHGLLDAILFRIMGCDSSWNYAMDVNVILDFAFCFIFALL